MQAGIDIALFGKGEAVGGLLAVFEYIRSGQIHRHRTGVGGGVGLFLTDMELFGLEFTLTEIHGKRSSFLKNRMKIPRRKSADGICFSSAYRSR